MTGIETLATLFLFLIFIIRSLNDVITLHFLTTFLLCHRLSCAVRIHRHFNFSLTRIRSYHFLLMIIIVATFLLVHHLPLCIASLTFTPFIH